MADDAMQLKGHVVGLLDVMGKECALDPLLADGVIEVLSGGLFTKAQRFIEDFKSTLADFIIGDMSRDKDGGTAFATAQVKLEKAIERGESLLHTLEVIKPGIALPTPAQDGWKSWFMRDWVLKSKKTLDTFKEYDEPWKWSYYDHYSSAVALYVTPLIVLNRSLNKEIWANKAAAQAAAAATKKTKAAEGQELPGAPAAKKARNK